MWRDYSWRGKVEVGKLRNFGIRVVFILNSLKKEEKKVTKV